MWSLGRVWEMPKLYCRGMEVAAGPWATWEAKGRPLDGWQPRQLGCLCKVRVRNPKSSALAGLPPQELGIPQGDQQMEVGRVLGVCGKQISRLGGCLMCAWLCQAHTGTREVGDWGAWYARAISNSEPRVPVVVFEEEGL